MAIHIRRQFDKHCIPAYSSPEDAARAMAALVHYGKYLQKNNLFGGYLEQFKKKVSARARK
jgi:acyl-CoA synthetase (NDP forming)